MITTSLQNVSPLAGNAPATPPAATVRDANASSATKALAEKNLTASAMSNEKLDIASVQEAASRVENFVRNSGSDLSFSVDRDTGINIITVVDRSTKEVIRQIPSREIIEIAQALDKVQGLLLRNQA